LDWVADGVRTAQDRSKGQTERFEAFTDARARMVDILDRVKNEGSWKPQGGPGRGAFRKDAGTGQITRNIPLLKAAPDGSFVLAPVLVPEEVDLEGDIISAEEIERAAYDFMEAFQQVGLMHDRMLTDKDVVLVESYISRVKMNIDGHEIKPGTWLAGFRIHNPRIRLAIVEGKLTGVSIGGKGIRTPEEEK
jgi:hypothetical protein